MDSCKTLINDRTLILFFSSGSPTGLDISSTAANLSGENLPFLSLLYVIFSLYLMFLSASLSCFSRMPLLRSKATTCFQQPRPIREQQCQRQLWQHPEHTDQQHGMIKNRQSPPLVGPSSSFKVTCVGFIHVSF